MSVEPELTMVLTDIDGISTLQSPKLDAVIEQVAVARAHAIRSGGGLPVARAGMGDAIWWLRSGIQPIDAAFCLRAHAEFAGRLLAAEGTDFPLHGPVVMAQGSGVRLPSIEHAVADSEVVDGDLSADITTDYVYSPAFKDMWLAMEGWWKALGPGALLVLCRNQDGAVHTRRPAVNFSTRRFRSRRRWSPSSSG